MRIIIKPDKYYLGHRYLVIIPSLVSDDIFFEYFFNFEDAKECAENYFNAEIIRILPFK